MSAREPLCELNPEGSCRKEHSAACSASGLEERLRWRWSRFPLLRWRGFAGDGEESDLDYEACGRIAGKWYFFFDKLSHVSGRWRDESGKRGPSGKDEESMKEVVPHVVE